MKNTGIIRSIDQLGRIVIPREIIKDMDLKLKEGKNKGSFMEIYTDEDAIVIKKHEHGCYLCHEEGNLQDVLGRKLCPKCLEELRETLKKVQL